MATVELNCRSRTDPTSLGRHAKLGHWFKDAIIYQLHVAHSTTATTTASAISAD